MMRGWMVGDWSWWGPAHGIFGMLAMLLFWVLIIVGAVLMIRWLVGQGTQKRSQPKDSTLGILEKRYVRGEIDKEKFEAIKRDLT